MDPISMAVLAALAGGVGGELGRQSWEGLSSLVRRRHRDSGASAEDTAAPLGEAELMALEETPEDRTRAAELERVLRARSEADAGFRRAVDVWAAQLRGGLEADPQVESELVAAARAVALADGAADPGDRIIFSGGTFHAPVLGKGTQYNQP